MISLFGRRGQDALLPLPSGSKKSLLQKIRGLKKSSSSGKP